MDWKDFLVNQAVTTFLMFLKGLKSPSKKAAAKKQVLKVYTSIKAIYGDDPDFE